MQFSECPHGTYGVNCSNKCQPLTYGWLCSEICNCSNSSCHHVYGCTGISCKYRDYSFLNQIYFKQTDKQKSIKLYPSIVHIICEGIEVNT